MKTNNNPNLIIRNGIYMFIRLLLVMIMAFYSTRITLQVLGDEDFGIHNIISGLISIFAIISMPITGALQRFFNVEYAKKKLPKKVVFNTSLRIVVIMAFFIFILYETIGIYFVDNVLIYPETKKITITIIFQITVLTSLCNFFTLIYYSLLVANEDLGIPATVEVLVAFFKLMFLFLMPFIKYDMLIIYSLVILTTVILQLIIYVVYCWRKYEETHINWVTDNRLLKDILKFSGWSISNSLAGISLTYISNVFINVYGGILYNTAYGLSQQLSNSIVSFSSNILKVADPQITCGTVAGQDIYRDKLVLTSIKACLLGVGFIFVLFLMYGDYLLFLWLKDVPNYLLEFCKISILNVLITSIILPLRAVILAMGNIKRLYLNYFHMAILANILMYLMLRTGFPVITVMYLILLTSICYLINAIIIVSKTTSLNYKRITMDILRVTMVLILSALLIIFLKKVFPVNIISLILIFVITFIFEIVVAYYIAITSVERNYLLNIIKNKIW